MTLHDMRPSSIEHRNLDQRPARAGSMSGLLAIEIEAILAVAGNVDAPATFECCGTDEYADQLLDAFKSGTGKLRAMLDAIEMANREGDVEIGVGAASLPELLEQQHVLRREG